MLSQARFVIIPEFPVFIYGGVCQNRMRFRYFKSVGHNINKSFRIVLNKRLKYYEASRYKKEG